MTSNKNQISGKIGDVIALVGGDTPDEVEVQFQRWMELYDEGSHAAALVIGAILDTPADKGQAAAQQLTNATTPAAAAVTTPQTPATTDGPREETDRYGAVFTYGIPGVPTCGHGPKVRKQWTTQNQKKADGFVCITQTPHGFRNKMQKSDCTIDWPKR